MKTTLSKSQVNFLIGTARGPNRTPFVGNRDAGRVASAWYRTAYSLERKGLVALERSGDASVATLTEQGRKILEAK